MLNNFAASEKFIPHIYELRYWNLQKDQDILDQGQQILNKFYLIGFWDSSISILLTGGSRFFFFMVASVETEQHMLWNIKGQRIFCSDLCWQIKLDNIYIFHPIFYTFSVSFLLFLLAELLSL